MEIKTCWIQQKEYDYGINLKLKESHNMVPIPECPSKEQYMEAQGDLALKIHKEPPKIT